MTPAQDSAEIVVRLRTIDGHVRAAERLMRAGRRLDAVVQLQAVRAALGHVAAAICRYHTGACLGVEPTPDAIEELRRVLYLMASKSSGRRSHGPVRPRVPAAHHGRR